MFSLYLSTDFLSTPPAGRTSCTFENKHATYSRQWRLKLLICREKNYFKSELSYSVTYIYVNQPLRFDLNGGNQARQVLESSAYAHVAYQIFDCLFCDYTGSSV